jgi:hypothetical protein
MDITRGTELHRRIANSEEGVDGMTMDEGVDGMTMDEGLNLMDMVDTSRTEAHHQVVRYSALIGGIFYGLLHQGTLQRKHDEDKVCLYSS